MNDISIIDPEYKDWIKSLSQRYRLAQIRAAVKVNTEALRFYWALGHDIVQMKAETRWGSKFFRNLSADLREEMPEAACFSETNLLYMKNFYLMYSQITPQLEEQMGATSEITPQT